MRLRHSAHGHGAVDHSEPNRTAVQRERYVIAFIGPPAGMWRQGPRLVCAVAMDPHGVQSFCDSEM